MVSAMSGPHMTPSSISYALRAFGSSDGRKLGGSEAEQSKPRWRNRLSISLPFRSRSKSPLRNANTQLVIPTIHENDLHLLENPRVLGDQQLLPGLPEEISAMAMAMDRVQQSLPMYRKLCWVVSDKAKLDNLLRTLTSLNDGLFEVLPTSAKSQAPALKLSFDIPFLPNIRKSSEFVGREYLLENLKQEVEDGKHTQNTIVLHGTGGMGKTQLALEYTHQHYKDYSSVFWINAASDQTTILGFTQIMQRLIESHAQASEDYSHIGRLLGMAGKLDCNGCFTVTQPSDAQHVVDAVKRWFALLENSNWRLVFDNLDDPDVVDIEEYIPACNHGIVIYCEVDGGSRCSKCNLWRPFSYCLEQVQCLSSRIWYLAVSGPYGELSTFVFNFDAHDSTETNHACLEQTTASTIAQELGYLPLALDQAGAFIHMAQYSLGRYLKEYQINASYLLSQGWKGGKQDRSVFATWEISFSAIQDKSPEAAKLLLICGFLNNEDIGEELLKHGVKVETHGMFRFLRPFVYFLCIYFVAIFILVTSYWGLIR